MFELFLKFFALKTLSEFETLKGLNVGENLKKASSESGKWLQKTFEKFFEGHFLYISKLLTSVFRLLTFLNFGV